MNGLLITLDGRKANPTATDIRELLASSTRFWLDIEGLDEETSQAILRETFDFHLLAVEDVEQFGQRPKVDTYDGYSLITAYGASQGHLVEFHCFYSAQYLVTVHQTPCPEVTQVAERIHRRAGPRPDHAMLLYMVLDRLIDGFFPVLEQLDDAIDALEDEILDRPTEQQLGKLFDLKRTLIAMRKVVTPQRDMFATIVSDTDVLADSTPDTDRYFRDLYDHLIRISDLVDSYRDLLSGALDTHLSTVSNRLNVVMKQLTIIATVFLPLTFLTGFFGQNFGWLVNSIGSFWVFLVFGLVFDALAVVGLLFMFRRWGWLSNDGTSGPNQRAKRPKVHGVSRWHTLHIPGHLPAHTPGHLPGLAGRSSTAHEPQQPPNLD